MRLLFAALAVAGLAGPAAAAVPVAEKEAAALRAVFPEAERFEPRDVLLDDAAAARIERLARARVRDRLVTFYRAYRGRELVGYAAIHSHVVRTKRETLSIAFEPDGRIRKIVVVSFLEPKEYEPSPRWLAQLEGKGPDDRLAVGQDLAPITGATLTARGVAEEARFLLQALREAEEVPAR